MEDSNTNPEESNSKEPSLEINQETKKEEKINAFNESLEKASSQNASKEKSSQKSEELISNKKNSIFIKFLNYGFDGISTNPNYKMLALLIILLINLSLFFVIGNLGKEFLRNAGIIG